MLHLLLTSDTVTISSELPNIFSYAFFWELFKSAILPVALFASGYYLNLKVEKRKERRMRKELKEYFLTLTQIVCDLALKQAELFENSAIRLQNINESERGTPVVAGFPHKSINDLPHDVLYRAIIEGNNIKRSTIEFNIIITKINYLQKVFNVVGEYSDEFKLVTNELDKRWSENGKKMTLVFSDIAGTRNVETALKSDDPLIREIGGLMDDIIEKRSEGFQSLYDNIILRLLEFINQDRNDDERNRLLTPIIVEFQEIFNQRKDLYERRMQSCKDTAKGMFIAVKEIKGTVQKLGKH
jgi:hypothetical protein